MAREQVGQTVQRLVPDLAKSRSKQDHTTHTSRLAPLRFTLFALLPLTPSGCRQCLHPRDILPMLLSRLAVFFTPFGHSLSKL